jgi:hypothetical protein
LVAEPLWWIYAVVIDLFQPRFPILAVVLVRRIAAPVARWIKCLTHQQPLRKRVVHENVVHFAETVSLAPLLYADLVGGHQDRCADRLRRSGDDDCLERSVRGYREVHSRREVESGGRLIEYSSTAYLPCVLQGREYAFAFLEYQHRFFVLRPKCGVFSGTESEPPAAQFADSTFAPSLYCMKAVLAGHTEERVG